MKKASGGMVVLLLLALMSGRAGAAIAEYTSDDDTAALYHLDEALGTKSTVPVPYPVIDEAGNVPLGTDLASPFDDVDSPDDLDTAATSYAAWKRTFRAGGINAKDVFNTEQFTIEAWIRDPGTPPASDTGINTIFSVLSAGEIRFAVTEDEKRLSLFYNLPGGVDDVEYVSDDDAVSFENNTWYHAAVTYDDHGSDAADDSTVTFYFTPESSFSSGFQQVGVHTGTEDLAGFADNDSGHVAVGERSGSNNFNGYIDEVRYSNVVRPFGAVIPEPGGLGAVGLALLALRRRR